MYQIPADVKDKEKIIGGYLTIVQFFWLLGGLFLGLMLFVVFFNMTNSLIIGLFLFILGIVSTTPFAFYKKKNLTLFQYFKYSRQIKKQKSELPNRRKRGHVQ